MSTVLFTNLVLRSNLRRLHLCDSRYLSGLLLSYDISAEGLMVLAGDSTIEELKLENFSALSDAGLATLLRHCTALTSLQLINAPNITVQILRDVAVHCPLTASVTFSNCSRILAAVYGSRPWPQYAFTVDVEDVNVAVEHLF